MPIRPNIREMWAETSRRNSQNMGYVGTVVDANATDGTVMMRIGGRLIRCQVPTGASIKYGEKLNVSRIPGSAMLRANAKTMTVVDQIVEAAVSTTSQAVSPPVVGTPFTPILWATAVSASEIFLEWGSTGENTTDFLIERRLGIDPFVQIATVPVSQTAYTDTGLLADTEYCYRVRAANGGQAYSEYSNIACATTLSEGFGPTTPILDDFNRADDLVAPPGPGWSDAWEYVLGLIVYNSMCSFESPTSGYGGGSNRWNTSFNENQEAYVTLARKHEPLGSVVIYLRTTGDYHDSDYYFAVFAWDTIAPSNEVAIRKMVSSVNTVLVTVELGFQFAVGDKLWFKSKDDTLTAYYQIGGVGDWVEAASVVDTDLSGGGYIVPYAGGGTTLDEATAFDDFGGGSI